MGNASAPSAASREACPAASSLAGTHGATALFILSKRAAQPLRDAFFVGLGIDQPAQTMTGFGNDHQRFGLSRCAEIALRLRYINQLIDRAVNQQQRPSL